MENDYAAALGKLHSKQLELEKRLSSTGLRNAWGEVTASISSESQVAKDSSANLSTLLARVQTTNLEAKRRRKHIKESLKSSTEQHDAYKVAVEGLRRKYEKRVTEYVELMDEQEGTTQAGGTAKEKESWPPHHWNGSDSSGRGRADSDGSTSTAPLSPIPSVPLHTAPKHFISGATSSGAVTPAYPPAIAKPSVLGQFKNEKDKVLRLLENVGKGEGHHAHRGSKSLQESAKSKRDAEDADRAYRGGIFQLETLRMNREKMGRSESTAILEFSTQMGTEIKGTNDFNIRLPSFSADYFLLRVELLLAYTDNVQFKGQSCVAISENIVRRISLTHSALN